MHSARKTPRHSLSKDDNSFYLSRFCKPYHLIPTGSIEIQTAVTIVHIDLHHHKTVFLCVLYQHCLLIDDAVTVAFKVIVTGQAHIQSSGGITGFLCTRLPHAASFPAIGQAVFTGAILLYPIAVVTQNSGVFEAFLYLLSSA